ncbi:MAG: Ig-like domain-containing protein [archaeon]
MKTIKLTLFVGVMLLALAGNAYAFDLTGYTYNISGDILNGTNVTVEVYTFGQYGPSKIAEYSNLSGTNGTEGWFNLTVPNNNSWYYKPVIRNYTGTSVSYIGPSLPEFGIGEMQMLTSSTIRFYLREAVGVNITAINGSDETVNYKYMLKDQKLGYAVAMEFQNYTNETVIWLRKDRNYSLMLYPNMSMPFAWDFNNGSAFSNGDLYARQFNLSESVQTITGYVSYGGSGNFTEMQVVAYLMEPGNMVFMQWNVPYNWSGAAVYNTTSGFYNISVPVSSENSSFLLFANAYNSSGNELYTANYRNITMTQANFSDLNFTTVPLVGNVTEHNLTANDGGNTLINTTKKTFLVVNSSGSAISQAHISMTVNYTAYNGSAFSFMTDVGGENTENANGIFKLPLLNASVQNIEIFAQNGGAPRKMKLTIAQLQSDPVIITLYGFDPKGMKDEAMAINMTMLNSTAVCDVPNPNMTLCSPAGSSGMGGEDSFKSGMFAAVIGGAKVSLRMTDAVRGITVHYVNVDMMASGPPDAMFDNESNESTEGNISKEEVWKFASTGPEIYDYIIVGFPYEDTTTGGGTVQEGLAYVSMDSFYDVDADDTSTWTEVWNESNGTEYVPVGYEDYNTSTYRSYLNGSKALCNSSDVNLSSGLCYIDTTNNMIWMKLPHFSGVGPQIDFSLTGTGNITLNSPADNNITTDATPDFNFTFVHNAESTADCNLYVGTTQYGNNSSAINNTATVITANATIANGSNTWYINCTTPLNDSGESASRTLWIDNGSLPTLLSVSPNGTLSGLATAVYVTFNDSRMNNETVNTSTFYVNLTSGGTSVGGTITNTSGTAFVYTFSNALSYATQYNVTVKEDVADIYGNQQGANVTWTFTTGSAPSGPSRTGDTGGLGSSAPTLQEGVEKTLSMVEGDSVGFRVEGSSHTAKIDSVSAGSVIMRITSDPILVTLQPGKITRVDVDSDGMLDLELLLNRIQNGVADITFKLYEEAEKQEITESVRRTATPSAPVPDEAPTAAVVAEEQGVRQDWTLPLAVVLILVVAGLGYYFYTKK